MSDWTTRRVLITGGLGFIGSNLAHRLVEKGADVTLLDNGLEGHGSNPANVESIRDDVTVVDADVRDESTVASHVDGTDVVYHCAAQNDRNRARENPHMDIAINCGGTINVLQAAESADPSPRVVFVSTLAVLGKPRSLPITESTPANPVAIYGANKRTAEHYCRIYNLINDVPTSVCRPANVYGQRAPVDVGYGIQTSFIATALRDEPITVFEPGDIQRDFVHVDDVVTALELIGTDDSAIGETYVVGTGEGTTLKSLATRIVDIAGTGEVKLVPWPDDWENIKRGDVYTDPSKIRAELDWEPTVALDAGLESTIQFYRDHRDQYF